MNTELFKKIHDQITSEPDGFDMNTWEGPGAACGTTRCVAGWAIYFATGSPLYGYSGAGAHPKVVELARDLGVKVYPGDSVNFEDFGDLGAKLLGLEGFDRDLFYASEEVAARFVQLAAAGDEDAAREVLNQ